VSGLRLLARAEDGLSRGGERESAPAGGRSNRIVVHAGAGAADKRETSASKTHALPEQFSAGDTLPRDRALPPPRVLVVEDSRVNQKVVVRLLGQLGCRADVASNGIEALTAHGRRAYNLILMDCQMPEMDGYEATAEIRSREQQGERIPIVALTGQATEAERQKCLQAGMDDYISKPVEAAALSLLLRRWMQRR
jgi:CheY-like chemotaxis protein